VLTYFFRMIRIPILVTENNQKQKERTIPELVLCQVPGLSCMGCCTAYKVRSRVLTEKQLEINTARFKQTKDPHRFSYESGPLVAEGSEICKTLIKEGNKIFCPAHPKSPYTNGKDMREFCIKEHWCPSMKTFLKWDKERQKAVIAFVQEQGHDWYSYSIANDTGKTIKDFLHHEKEEAKKVKKK